MADGNGIISKPLDNEVTSETDKAPALEITKSDQLINDSGFS